MNAPVGNWLERLLGRGRASVTVPALDGTLKPNHRLEAAPAGIVCAEPDNLVVLDDDVIWSSGGTLLRGSSERNAIPFAAMGDTITAMAVSPGGQIAVARESKGIAILDADGNETKREPRNAWPEKCVTALAFDGETSLIACVGSTVNRLDAWQRDLLEQRRAGSLWRLDIAGGHAKRLVGALAFPNGVLVADDGALIVSESWSARLVKRDANGREVALLADDLPGYPGRLARSGRGGYWLTIFAPRSPLIEFVLRENVYRRAMLAEVPPQYWIAPTLRSGLSFHEPMQGGALKQMGILKPWAPTLSYGLVIELDHAFVPLQSFHSRAGGKRHGVTSAVEASGRLWLTSKGGDEVISIDLAARGVN